jgi:predicted permease
MPNWKAEIRARLEGLRLDPVREAEIADELAADLDDRFADLVARGMSPADAATAIRRDHLSETALQDLRGFEHPAPPPGPGLGQESARWWRGLGADLRYGLRSLRKSPGLSVVALLTLAIGIGANVTIFSVVNAALLRPLPFTDPDRLVSFWGTAPDKGLPVVNYPEALYHHYAGRLRSIDPIAFYAVGGMTLTGRGEPERVTNANTTVDFFRLLGINPARGRAFVAEEFQAGKNLVTLLSHRFWQQRFGGDPAIIGQALILNNLATTVVGVLPPGFDFPGRVDLYIPLPLDQQSLNCWCYDAIGRLAPGRTETDLAWEIDQGNAGFWAVREPERPRAAPKRDDPRGTVVQPLARVLAGEVRAPAMILLGAVGMVLLIACANLANLLLARASGRRREIAVRCALGASPGRVARQLLVESLLLSIGGAALGLGLATVGVTGLGRLAIERLSYVDRVAVDWLVLTFGLGLGIASGLVFGVVPALSGARTRLLPALRDGTRGTDDRARRRLNDGFVVAQLALSLILLTGTGLLLKSFTKLLHLDRGFDAANVTVGRIAIPWSIYSDMAQVRSFTGRLEERLEALPGVTALGFSSTAPFSRGNNQQEMVAQGHEPGPGQPIPVASVRRVSTGFFAAIGTSLIRGRDFGEADRDSSELVAVIDETLARRYWPDGNAIGGRIATGNIREPVWRTVIGVVESVRHGTLDRKLDHYVYQPLSQGETWNLDLVVRSTMPQAALIAALRREIFALDPTVPLFDARALEATVERSLDTRKLTNLLLASFAVAALLLAAIGIYGVMSRTVVARVREFGVRLALGASPNEVKRLVLRGGVRLVAIGTGIGILGALLLTRFLTDMLFEVSPIDPLVLAAAPILLGAVGLAACYWPARRATKVDPLEAIRGE